MENDDYPVLYTDGLGPPQDGLVLTLEGLVQ